MAKFFVHTLGCKVNQVESDGLTAMLLERGHKLASADYEVAIINGCAVTNAAEKKSLRLIERIKQQIPGVKVIFAGCAAEKLTPQQRELLHCDGVVGNGDKHRLPDILDAMLTGQLIQANEADEVVFPEYAFEQYPQLRTRAFIKIQDGCDNYCSYCIIPYLRGGVRSRSITSILQEVNAVVAAGFKEIVLTGIHLGNYGKERGFEVRLHDVVECILQQTTIERIRLGSIESPEISEQLLKLFEREPRLCRHLHLPLQAGCDVTLRQMNRNYQTNDYRLLVEQITRRFPDMAITADIIVGFPGETDADFAQTCAFVEQLPLAGLHVFPFSRRSGTVAWSMPQQIDNAKKKLRAKAMTELGATLQQKFLLSCINVSTAVLLESIADGFAYGFSSNYQKIYLHEAGNVLGEICLVKPLAIYQDGLRGQLV